MKQYDAYKSTGIEWIGEVPEHWEVNRIKFLAKRSASGVWGDDEKGNDNDIICYRVADFDYNHLTLKNEELTYRNISNSELEGRCISKGDLLIEKSGGGDVTPVGRVVISNNTNRATCSNFVHSITLKEDYNSSFMCYYFHALYSNKVNLLYFNQTTGIQNLKVYEYLGQHIYLPPLLEQESIAKYLDEKCGSIDKVIATQEKRVALLNELKQSVISEAVTRGINPDAQLKNTGIEWIGEIPEHWEVKKISHIYNHIGSGTTPNTGNKDFYCDCGGINWLQTGDLNDGYITNTAKQISSEAVSTLNLKIYPEHSVVIAMYGATIGKVGILDICTTVNQACCVLETSKYMNEKYSFYSFISAKKSLIAQSAGGGQPNISQDIIRRHKMPIPPLSEQEAIAKYLDEKCSRFDILISKANKEIELLKEYKQTIISEAVTGKIKVC